MLAHSIQYTIRSFPFKHTYQTKQHQFPKSIFYTKCIRPRLLNDNDTSFTFRMKPYRSPWTAAQSLFEVHKPLV